MHKLPILRKNPLVSIITPTYNCGSFLEENIRSVLNQNYPNVEHIIQDCLSTDKTVKILEKYSAAKFKNKIRIRSEQDCGQSEGLNRALKNSRGDILLVLNADDILLPDAVGWGVEKLKSNPMAAAVYGDMYIINSQGEITDIYKADEYFFDKLICVEIVPPAQASFIRRSALEKVGFWADISLDTCPDYEMWLRLGYKFPIKHEWGIITKYRVHDQPQLDSKRTRSTARFVASKRIVMDRLLKNPKTPEKLRNLSHRAYVSLDLWAYRTAMSLGQYRQAGYYLLRSFLRQPSWSTAIIIINMSVLFTASLFAKPKYTLRVFLK